MTHIRDIATALIRHATIATERGAFAFTLEPWSPSGEDDCLACGGRGGELDCDEDGPFVEPTCRACCGTGHDIYCCECVEGWVRGGDPESWIATRKLTAPLADGGECVRLVCSDPDHLGMVLQEMDSTVKRENERYARACVEAEKARAIADELHAEAERSGLLGPVCTGPCAKPIVAPAAIFLRAGKPLCAMCQLKVPHG